MSLPRTLVMILIQILGVFVLGFQVLGPMLLGAQALESGDSVGVFVFVLALAAFSCGGVVWLGCIKLGRRTWRETGWHTDNLLRNVALGLGGTAVCVAITYGMYRAVGASHQEFVSAFLRTSVRERVLYGLVGLQAGLSEETLFRGNLQPALAKKMPYGVALVLGAVIFSLYHLNPNPISLINKTLLGTVFGALAWRTRSLVAPAVCHGVFWVMLGRM